jgi:hypothetical protein
MRGSLFILALLSALSLAVVSGDLVAGYLDALGENMTYEREGNEFILLAAVDDTTDVPYMYILVDPEMEGCLLVALTPGVVPASGAGRTTALETLSELNWNNTWVKYALDPTTNEVSAMYTFSTEDGLGEEAFSVMLNLLLGTVDEDWETLSSL